MSHELVVLSRTRLADGVAKLVSNWRTQRKGDAMLSERSALVDEVLRAIWTSLDMPEDIALVAVGGYGRGELYPFSDVDLLILLPDGFDAGTEPRLEQLIGTLWDIGLDIGHSVRNRKECLEEAERDITVKTSLLDARWLCGTRATYDGFAQGFRAAMDPAAFFRAKRLEQSERHARFNDTPYALEPNCKESPGGLRDLHVILWIAQAAGIGKDWNSLAETGLIRPDEARLLEASENWLRDLRIELHLLAGRREERLLFDHQEKLALAMSIEPSGTRRAAEILMQRYFRNAKRIMQLNALVLATLADRLQTGEHPPPIVVDANFQTVRDLIDIRDEAVFERNPAAILECFLLQMQRSELKGMTPRTLRALWHARGHINQTFRQDPENRARFLRLFQQKHLIHALRGLNQYDILGRYLPAFGLIVGQMQHDLFHVYTVDQHILQVMRNLRRFAMPEFAHEYPFCSRLMMGWERPWLLYVAALFHDIAKGRGGDHSKLGMADARQFCEDHGLSTEDTDLVVFLVEHHLTMSSVAQKQDLADPDVVQAFADLTMTHRRLTALYLLTVADIRGTGPKVWNAWKGKLLEDLYRMTARLLSGETPAHLTGVPERQQDAQRLLHYHGLRPDVEAEFWEQLDTGYFIGHDAEEIAWHTRTLYHRPSSGEPVVRARLKSKVKGIQVMVYTPDQPLLFSRICGVFARMGYSIVDAKIHTTRHGYALDSFVVLYPEGDQNYRDMTTLLEHELTQQLLTPTRLLAPPTGRLSRQVKHFPITPEVDIRTDEKGDRYLMTISAADRTGLLYSVAQVLGAHDIQLHTAKIATLGERVEDVFLISGQELAQPAALVRLEQDLLATLQV